MVQNDADQVQETNSTLRCIRLPNILLGDSKFNFSQGLNFKVYPLFNLSSIINNLLPLYKTLYTFEIKFNERIKYSNSIRNLFND
jgi:hypothetical protein